MRNSIAVGLLLVGAALATGCATGRKDEPQVGFTHAATKAIGSTRVVIGVDNSLERNTAHVTYGGGAQFGLIGVVVETALAASSEKARQTKAKSTAGVRAAAIKFNFAGAFKSELEKSLRNMPWLNVSHVYADVGVQSQNTERLLSEISDDALMVADVAYALTPDMRKLVVGAYVDVHPKNPKLAPLAQVSSGTPVLFRKGFEFEYPLEGEYVDDAQAAEAWSRNDGEVLHRALSRAVTELAAKIEASLRPL